MSKLKAALKNENVKSLIILATFLGGIVAFWFGLRTYLRTEYPLLAVASGSMVPTLNVGDLIVVQGGLNPEDIVAAYGTGDIIVFHSPRDHEELIVHRAVDKFENEGVWYFKTKGDHNSNVDPWPKGGVPEDDVVGKVVWSIPYLGHIPLFIRTPTGMLVIVILIIVLILLEFVIPSAKEEKGPEQPKEETGILHISLL